MPKLAANLSMLYPEHVFLDRFDAARADGFRAVECMFPYAFEAAFVAEALARNGLTLVLHNMPPGDWRAGERGLAALPGRVDEFRAAVDTAIGYASALGCGMVNCLAGVVPPDVPPATARATLVANLRYAAPRFAAASIRLLVEPVNRHDVPGFHLDTVETAMQVIGEAACDNLFLQYDLYHRQRSGGELLATFAACRDSIAHLQIADTPGRHEPGTGEINYPHVFAALDAAGYTGWIGCEYRPLAGTSAGLGWAREYLTPAA